MDETLKTILSLLVVPLAGAVSTLFWLYVKQRNAHEVAIADLRAEYENKLEASRKELEQVRLRAMRVEVDLARTHSWIESRWGDDFGDAVIVVDAENGLICEWNPSATVLFHWTMRESLMKPITRLIPQRYMDQHNKAWAEWKMSGHSPRRGPFQLHANTKDGEEVPVSITYSGWYDGNKRYVAAYIRKREEVVS